MNRQNTVSALLAVIAALLGLNLIAKSSPAAVGQGQAGPTQPVPVDLSVGQIVGTDGSGLAHWRVFRLWSDGAVDTTQVSFRDAPGVANCEISEICLRQVLPGSCTADITRNGEVEITDFLEVLGQWGPCE